MAYPPPVSPTIAGPRYATLDAVVHWRWRMPTGIEKHPVKRLFTAILAGAAGYVLKQIDETALVSGIRAVVKGHSLIEAGAAIQVIERMRSGASPS